MASKTAPADRHDVLIFEIATRKVDHVGGRDLRLEGGTHNARKRQETIFGRLNDRFDVGIFPAGKHKVGDVLPKA